MNINYLFEEQTSKTRGDEYDRPFNGLLVCNISEQVGEALYGQIILPVADHESP
jgi:hypothetical protein